MPAYYFHLAFELYRHSYEENELSHPDETAKYLIPPRNFNLFRSNTPYQQASSWASFIAPRRESRKGWAAKEGVTRRSSNSRPALEPEEHLAGVPNGEARDLPKSTQAAPQTPTLESRGTTQTHETDWRFGRVAIESIDMELQKPGHASDEKERHMTAMGKPSTARGDVALRGKYIPSNPETTEFGWGVVHLFRDTAESPELGDGIRYSKEASRAQPVDLSADVAFVDKQCTTLCILAVPSYMTPSDLLGWLGEETREIVSHLRLVRTGRSNRYMVLLKFRGTKMAKKWQKEWNGKLFNSAEPENCHVVFIKSIQFQAPDVDRDPTNFPDMSNDPFTPMVKPQSATSSSESTSRTKSSLTAKPAPPPTAALVELPTCPVCLERMDETTGLATIFCQHVFHCACLQKWRGSGCPVCRYTQDDPGGHGRRVAWEESECKMCGTNSNLWVCLICGHVGCGRYESAHAHEHYEETAHSYAMDVVTQHVWDYVGDGYVHRLIQSAADGKLFELPSALAQAKSTGSTTMDRASSASVSAGNIAPTLQTTTTADTATDLLDTSPPTNKLETLSLEYTNLLTSQLDSQRLYFEQQLDRAVDKAARASADAVAASITATEALAQHEAIQSAHDQLISQTLPTLQAEAARAEKRAERADTVAKKMEKAWREGESVAEGLMARIKHLEGIIEAEKAKNEDLEEQNRDLTFFISGAERLRAMGEDGNDDLVEGTVSVAPGVGGVGRSTGTVQGETETSAAKKRKKKQKKKRAVGDSGDVVDVGGDEGEADTSTSKVQTGAEQE